MSPTRALHPCSVSNCPTLTRTPRCIAHTVTREERNPKDPQQAKFYGSTQWKTLRKIVKARDPICKLCNRAPTQEADHIDDNWQNNVLENLQGVCTPCHATKSGRQHHWRKVPAKHPFLILVGQAGVGKTTIRHHLAYMLGYVSIGPDDYDGRWTDVYEVLDRSRNAVVECCIPPGALVRRAEERGAYVVELTAPPSLRRARLHQRCESSKVVEQRMREVRKMGYERELSPNLVVDTSKDALIVAREIAEKQKNR